MVDGEIPPKIGNPGKRGGARLLVVAAWCGLIFATSSTVVTAQRFYAWVADHALTDPEAFQRFAVFWGLSWFAIVKGWHAAEYAILFACLKAALDRFGTAHPRRNVALALASCLLFAASDEYHQTLVPGRNGTWADVAIDGLGAGVAALVSIVRRGRKGGPNMKRVVPGAVLLASMTILGPSAGCSPKPNGTLVYEFKTNDYAFEYDGEQKKITIGPGLMRMVRHPEDIEVSRGILRVGPREYGPVARDDKISVVGGKVAVNGQPRQPAGP